MNRNETNSDHFSNLPLADALKKYDEDYKWIDNWCETHSHHGEGNVGTFHDWLELDYRDPKKDYTPEILSYGYRLNEVQKYHWEVRCSDSKDVLHSPDFNSFEECREDMVNHAIKKMKWNTGLADFSDSNDADDFFHYDVDFFRDSVVHTSYSGTYTYVTVPTVK